MPGQEKIFLLNKPDLHLRQADELVHVRQGHSADIIWMELVCILNWYNPLAWLLRYQGNQGDTKILVTFKPVDNNKNTVLAVFQDGTQEKYELSTEAGKKERCPRH